ncbi:alkyl hydroperoxide reductase [Corynebacterium kefirresidentii]|uniref:alkyl hydroperoxide reductase n=1 Tax=Corynebacterium TaxID=1716 RepID=UPI00254FA055|nr:MULTISPECIES: alkyl hydroperoxide reductase [Corynebacterium]MDK8524985.1 alkyl hydroperoxide reductase [Corynebacterium sp. MSK150]MDK8587075.1 alkyl hydroperoxide reductase [Corynebacterium kefirresidentii]
MTFEPGARVLAKVQRSSPAAVNYVAVDIASYETANEIREFLAGNGASSLAFASDTDTRLITAYRINQVSTAVILDAAGTEVFRAVEPGAA